LSHVGSSSMMRICFLIFETILAILPFLSYSQDTKEEIGKQTGLGNAEYLMN